MRAYDLIWKKREGKELTREELHFLISGFVKGEIPDYQISAWCMAVFFQGMSFVEATNLTLEMLHSGEQVDLTSIPGIKVDKHSTGGVGDKTSLVLLPLVAAAGIPVAKMSGRGLGHTGGTIDKLESIPGFSTSLTKEQFLRQVADIGIVLAGQTADLVPADKKLYALRDLTATVESIPLIAGSIVSKKLASGADAVLLDVKYGAGAFMREFEAARELARTMVEIGNRAGRQFKAVITDMNQPLGRAIGNSLEVAEAIRTLRGEGPADLTELCLTMGGLMIWLGQRAETPEAGKAMAEEMLRNGSALVKFTEFIRAQGGDPGVIEDLSRLPQAPEVRWVNARVAGWVASIGCRDLGLIAMELGAGRVRLGESIKPQVGIELLVKVGDRVES
ncbi:MAG TPA: thymidine phosphorylase, partial [Bacillota bacterium]|nr:thymidine phosphorylase [Bacillota bacterium]